MSIIIFHFEVTVCFTLLPDVSTLTELSSLYESHRA